MLMDLMGLKPIIEGAKIKGQGWTMGVGPSWCKKDKGLKEEREKESELVWVLLIYIGKLS